MFYLSQIIAAFFIAENAAFLLKFIDIRDIKAYNSTIVFS